MNEVMLGGSICIWGWMFSLFLLIIYFLCVGYGLLMLVRFYMFEVWVLFLFGFEWLMWLGFIVGVVGSFFYGWYVVFLLVLLYCFFSVR